MKSIQVFGTFRGPTGYDQVVRNVVQKFYYKGIMVGLHEFEDWSPVRMPVSVLFDNMAKASDTVRSDYLLAFCLPEQISHKGSPYRNKLIANYTMIETDRIPQRWVDYATSTDIIIVPTEFNRRAWIDSGVNEARLEVVPLGIDPEVFNPKVDPLPLFDMRNDGENIIDKYPKRFLNIQEVVDRKNLDGLLLAWMAATKGVEDACLILKLSSYSENRLEYFGRRMKRLREQAGVKPTDHAPIFAYPMTVLDEQMPSVVATCTHYISTSCGEGWDLNMMAAASMNKILIAPRNSSYQEYLRDDYAYLIDCLPEPANQRGPTQRIYHGSQWYRPELSSTVEQIQAALGHEDPVRVREKVILPQYTWEHVAAGIESVVDRRLVNHRPTFSVAKKADRDGVLMACKSSTGRERCGISEYSKSLVGSLRDELDKVGLMGGHEPAYVDHIDNNKIKTLHIQYEYQFHTPDRIRHLGGEMKGRGGHVVITQHTLNRSAVEHNMAVNDVADAILVHSEYAKEYAVTELGYDKSKVHVVTMACNPVIYGPPKNALPLPHDKFKIGFFGFSYFHKGIGKLLMAYNRFRKVEQLKDTMLVIVSNKPAQDAVGYFEQCQNMLYEMGLKPRIDYIWVNNFLPEEQVIGFLKQCDVINLPYDDYGGVGTSAAIKTVMRAGRPILASDTCWFSDVPDDVVPKLSNDVYYSELVANLLRLKSDEEYAADLASRVRSYAEEATWAKAAQEHAEIYRSITDGS